MNKIDGLHIYNLQTILFDILILIINAQVILSGIICVFCYKEVKCYETDPFFNNLFGSSLAKINKIKSKIGGHLILYILSA